MVFISDLHKDTVGIRDQLYFALQEQTGIYKGSALKLNDQTWGGINKVEKTKL